MEMSIEDAIRQQRATTLPAAAMSGLTIESREGFDQQRRGVRINLRSMQASAVARAGRAKELEDRL